MTSASHVLLTRPQPEASNTAALLEQSGYAVTCAPISRFEPRAVQLPDLSGFDAVAITSPRALHDQLDLSDLLGRPVFAIGEATATSARRFGFRQVKYNSQNSAHGMPPHAMSPETPLSDLARLIGEHRPAHVLFLGATRRSGDLVGMLEKNNIGCTLVETYDMPSVPLSPDIISALKNQKFSFVLHYSRRAAKLFAQMVQNDGNAHHVCFSQPIAETLPAEWKTHAAIRADERALFDRLAQLRDAAGSD